MTIALLISFETCFVRMQCIYFACTKTFSDLLKEAFIRVLNGNSCNRFAKFLLKTKEFVFLEVWSRDFYFVRNEKNQFKMLLVMCFIQYVQTKRVFTFQPTKMLIFAAVKSAKLALTCWKVAWKTNNRQLCCLVVMVHVALQKNESRLWKKKSVSIFEEISPSIGIKHNRTWPKNAKINPFIA